MLAFGEGLAEFNMGGVRLGKNVILDATLEGSLDEAVAFKWLLVVVSKAYARPAQAMAWPDNFVALPRTSSKILPSIIRGTTSLFCELKYFQHSLEG